MKVLRRLWTWLTAPAVKDCRSGGCCNHDESCANLNCPGHPENMR